MADELQGAQRYTDLLKRLPGVYAAQVRLGPAGHPEEVHLLAGMARHPKQLVRDARTALLSSFDVDIDYQKFSIAQLSDELGESLGTGDAPAISPSERLRCGGIQQSLVGERYNVSVTLNERDASFQGNAYAHNSPTQRQRAVASAVLDAVHQSLNAEQPIFMLLAVQRVITTPVPVFVVLIESLENERSTLLIGAAESGENEALSVQKATLDALNRKLLKVRPL